MVAQKMTKGNIINPTKDGMPISGINKAELKTTNTKVPNDISLHFSLSTLVVLCFGLDLNNNIPLNGIINQ